MVLYYLTVILDFLSKIAWPVALVFIIIRFKEPISVWIKKVGRISFGGAEIESKDFQTRTHIGASSSFEGTDPIKIIEKLTKSTDDKLTEVVEKETNISSSDLRENERTLFSYSKLLIILGVFKSIYNTIYGSQLKILNLLKESPAKKEDLKKYYDRATRYNPSFFKEYPYASYLNFLFSYELITEDVISEEISLTDMGKDFLTYIEEYNLNSDLPN